MTNPAPFESSALHRVSPIAYPLDDFYSRAGLPLPRIESIPGESLPEPYHHLLVHERDMTPTLESFFKEPVELEVLRCETRGDSYFREVVLHLRTQRTPIEFGAIRINLSLFTPEARRVILEGKQPLGHILHDFHVRHSSRPKAYLRVQADALISSALATSENRLLFGRRNTLADPHQRSIAEIVEILPPLTSTPQSPSP